MSSIASQPEESERKFRTVPGQTSGEGSVLSAPPSMSGDVRCRAPSREAIYRPLFDQVVQHPRDGV